MLGIGLGSFSLCGLSVLPSSFVFFLPNLDFSSSMQFLPNSSFSPLRLRSRMQIIAVTLKILYFKSIIEMLSKGIDVSKSTLNKVSSAGSLQEKRDRLLKIEQKLEAITAHKLNQAKEESEEELTRRVLEVEALCAGRMRDMEAKVRELRESCSEIKLREGEFLRKCELSRKARIKQIRTLQKQLTSLISFEAQQRKDLENSLTSIFERKDKEITSEIAHLRQARIEAINHFEAGIAQELPEAALSIEARLEEVEVKLEVLHQQVKVEAQTLKDKLQRAQQERDIGIRTVNQAICRATEQLKEEILEERAVRQSSKIKILGLFNQACGRLNLL